MNESDFSLNRLPIGRSGVVRALTSRAAGRRRMLDLGLTEGTRVTALLKSPAGDPVAYEIRGAVIALRAEDAGKVLLR